MRFTDVEIFSRALVSLGRPPISSFDQPQVEAIAGRTVYQQVRKALLSKHPWSFAFREVDISPLDPTLRKYNSQYAYAYQIPTDCLVVAGLVPYPQDYWIFGDEIHSDEDTLTLRYIADVPETEWPPYFAEAMAARLTAELAVAILDNVQRAQVFEIKAREAEAKAMHIDAMQRPTRAINMDLPLLRPPTPRY